MMLISIVGTLEVIAIVLISISVSLQEKRISKLEKESKDKSNK